MNTFDTITIIYNPKSTGDSTRIALRLHTKLLKLGIAKEVIVRPTEYAGHAEKIAKLAAEATKQPLIVSVSGDGGYNEVVNGILASNNSQAVCTVEGAGNANDHWRVVHRKSSLIRRLKKNLPYTISLLKLSTAGPERRVRYAHSYIGFGITAKVAEGLNSQTVTRNNERKMVVRSVLKNQAFSIETEGDISVLDSLVMANINQMGKQFKLEKKLHVDTADFKVISHKHEGPLRLATHIIGASIRPSKAPLQTSRFAFIVLDPVWAQCDGETFKLPTETRVVISGIKDGLRTI